jgi:hypothetical protein
MLARSHSLVTHPRRSQEKQIGDESEAVDKTERHPSIHNPYPALSSQLLGKRDHITTFPSQSRQG